MLVLDLSLQLLVVKNLLLKNHILVLVLLPYLVQQQISRIQNPMLVLVHSSHLEPKQKSSPMLHQQQVSSSSLDLLRKQLLPHHILVLVVSLRLLEQQNLPQVLLLQQYSSSLQEMQSRRIQNLMLVLDASLHSLVHQKSNQMLHQQQVSSSLQEMQSRRIQNLMLVLVHSLPSSVLPSLLQQPRFQQVSSSLLDLQTREIQNLMLVLVHSLHSTVQLLLFLVHCSHREHYSDLVVLPQLDSL